MPTAVSRALFERVRTKAARQYGVVSRPQLVALGASPGWIRGRREHGDLVRVQPQVFRVVGFADSWHGHASAACLQCGRAAVLSHSTAARLRGLELPDQEACIEVTVPRSMKAPALDAVKVHRATRLTSADRALFENLPVTTVARTMVDLASRLDDVAIARLVDDAILRGIVQLPVLRSTIVRLARKGCAGPARVERALRPWLLGRLESHAEAEVLRRLLVWHLPPPLPQYQVALGGGLVARVDFAWPAHRLALEVDGFSAHDGPRKFVADRQRWNRLRAAGWDVVQVTIRELREDPSAVSRVLHGRLRAVDLPE